MHDTYTCKTIEEMCNVNSLGSMSFNQIILYMKYIWCTLLQKNHSIFLITKIMHFHNHKYQEDIEEKKLITQQLISRKELPLTLWHFYIFLFTNKRNKRKLKFINFSSYCIKGFENLFFFFAQHEAFLCFMHVSVCVYFFNCHF